MNTSMQDKKEKVLYSAFEIGIAVKAVDSIAEIIVGLLFLIINPAALSAFLSDLIDDWFAEDLHGFGANFLHHALSALTPQGQHFAAFLLLSHGIVKIVLVVKLYQRRLWAYPAAAVVFSLFILYQIYHLSVAFSWGLTALTIVDAAVVWLALHEYRLRLRTGK